MTEYRIGTGGDYADWRTAWNAIAAAAPSGAHYRLTQISDITASAGYWTWLDNMDYNTIEFVNSNPPNGDPTKGYVTNMPGDTYFWVDTNSVTAVKNSIIIDGLWLKRSTANSDTKTMLSLGSGDNSFTIKNCLVKGTPGVNQAGPGPCDRGINCTGSNQRNLRVSNCKIWNCLQGLCGIGGTSPVQLNSMVIENVIVYNCNIGFYHSGGGTNPIVVTYRNCVSVFPYPGGTPRDWVVWDGEPYPCPTYNCAASDGTLALRTNSYNSISNVTASQFASLDDTSPNFLKFTNNGTKRLSAAADPIKGAAPMAVQFVPDVSFDYGSMGSLAYSGMAPTIAATDIEGNDRPGDDDAYSIGCHEAQFSHLIT